MGGVSTCEERLVGQSDAGFISHGRVIVEIFDYGVCFGALELVLCY